MEILPHPCPINRTPHYTGHVCFSFFFPFLLLFSLSFVLCRMAGFVKFLPCKFLQLCILRLPVSELALSGLPVGALFTFEATLEKRQGVWGDVNTQEEAGALRF